MNWQWLIDPGVGAVIGYITNDIAVRMLFRPREPKYLFGRQLPFTPGLIPKSRYRLSQAVGGLVGSELLSGEVLQRALLSDAMRERISRAIDELCENAARDERAARELIPSTIEPEKLEAQIDGIIKALSLTMSERLTASGFETTLAEQVVADLRSRITTTPFAPLRLFWDDRFSKSMSDRLAKAISDMVNEHGAQWIETLVKGAVNESLDTTVADWYTRAEPYVPRIKEAAMSAYERLVRDRLDRALEAIDIGAILRAHIDSLDMREVERMILGIMKRELRAIVWLGALLGALMGITNALMPG
ncbi:MAG: DUF445 family protein [Oscillospiraceae bacterium]|jgi:uncharacterized membrane protein YheB (UPF0754 family)|nr:DUF445 family protein [Oscillospiraceae bacterium]